MALVLLAVVIGFLFLTRATMMRRVRGAGVEAAPVAAGEAAFRLTVAVLTGCMLVPGNRVEIALNGDETFDRLWSDLRFAERAILESVA